MLALRSAPDTRTVPPSCSTRALSFCSPFKCRSMGRCPMAHPPGMLSTHSPARARIGPITSTDARMVRSKAASRGLLADSARIRISLSFWVTSAPQERSTSAMWRTSVKKGI